MGLLWIMSQVISPVFGLIYGLALSPRRFSKCVTLTVSALLISALTAANMLLINYFYSQMSVFPAFDILYRVLNIVLVSAIVILLIKREPAGKKQTVRILFGMLSVCVCVLAVDTLAITLRTLLGSCLLELIIVFLLYTLMLLVVIKMRKPFLEVIRYMKNRLWPLCLVLLVLICTVLTQISIIGPLEQNQENIPVALLLCAVTIAVFGIIFYLFRAIRKQNALEQSTAALRLYTLSLEQQNELISKNAEKAALFRHDIRHVSKMMSSCAENGDLDGIKELIKLLDKNVSADGGLAAAQITGSKLLDTVLNTYIRIAKESEIDLSINVSGVESISADTTELAVVFANALENAVHACLKLSPSEKRAISVKGGKKGLQYFLEISNTFSGEVQFDSDKGLPVTHEEGHGTGVKSIACFAEKHGAELSFRIDGDLFLLRMLLKTGQ